jgi:eukaryotic-like serine/threonine-protein kinase
MNAQGGAALASHASIWGRMEIRVGHIVGGKYELARLLGRGSMGEVWLAHHRTLGEDVALKLLTRQRDGGEIEDPRTATARFQFEAQVAARLSRKTRHIVRVTDHGEEDGLPYLVMELLDGHTLEAQLMRRGRLPLAEVPTLVAQVARALEEAHSQGVVHRDLKPANIFLTHDEDGRVLVKLLDFGIARAVHAQRLPSTFSTGRGLVFGTPGYMSPEQARASAKLDHRCDLWALATVAYEALTGELPVPGADTEELLMNLCAGLVVPVRERDPELPEPLTWFFERAFARRIEDRFASASDLARALEQALVHASVESQEARLRGGPPERRLGSRNAKTSIVASRPLVVSGAPTPAPRRDRWSVVALGLVVAAIAGVALWAGGGARYERSGSPPVSPGRASSTAAAARSEAPSGSAAASAAEEAPAPPPSPSTSVPPPPATSGRSASLAPAPDPGESPHERPSPRPAPSIKEAAASSGAAPTPSPTPSTPPSAPRKPKPQPTAPPPTPDKGEVF